MLEDLFISKVRVKILQLFLSNPKKIFHVRDIVRRVKEEINAVRRELARMDKASMAHSEWRANRRFWWFRKDYIFYPELLALVSKTIGLGGDIIKNKNRLGKVKYAALSYGFVTGRDSGPNDVDLLVVGNVVLPELSAIVKEEEARREKEINYTVMSEEEFNFRKKRRDPFITEVLENPLIMLLGDREEMTRA